MITFNNIIHFITLKTKSNAEKDREINNRGLLLTEVTHALQILIIKMMSLKRKPRKYCT